MIHIGKPIPFDTEVFLKQLEELAVVAYGNEPGIRRYVEEIVPTYHAAEEDLRLHGETYKKLFNKATENNDNWNAGLCVWRCGLSHCTGLFR